VSAINPSQPQQQQHAGTAGLRAKMGPGFNRMNAVTIQQTTQGLLRYLQATSPQQLADNGVIIGGWWMGRGVDADGCSCSRGKESPAAAEQAGLDHHPAATSVCCASRPAQSAQGLMRATTRANTPSWRLLSLHQRASRCECVCACVCVCVQGGATVCSAT
jgi:hypothetical protein